VEALHACLLACAPLNCVKIDNKYINLRHFLLLAGWEIHHYTKASRYTRNEAKRFIGGAIKWKFVYDLLDLFDFWL